MIRAMAFDFPNIDPVAFSLGPLVVRWYALAYVAGFLLGWKYCLSLIKNRYPEGDRPHKDDIDDFLPWAIVGVILGGRLGYVLFYQSGFYFENPLEILKIWRGGMSFHGGVCGVIAASYFYSRLKQFSFLKLCDLLACATPIGLFFGRIANFINGELYGRTTDMPWAVRFPHGGYEPRHPSQLYEAILEGALLFAALYWLAKRESIRLHTGILSGVFLIGYGASRFFVEFYREPDAHIGLVLDIVSMGQILCLPMILGGAVLIVYARRKTDKSWNSSETL